MDHVNEGAPAIADTGDSGRNSSARGDTDSSFAVSDRAAASCQQGLLKENLDLPTWCSGKGVHRRYSERYG